MGIAFLTIWLSRTSDYLATVKDGYDLEFINNMSNSVLSSGFQREIQDAIGHQDREAVQKLSQPQWFHLLDHATTLRFECQIFNTLQEGVDERSQISRRTVSAFRYEALVVYGKQSARSSISW